MNLNNINREKKRYFKILSYLSAILDFLISPSIKKRMIYSLEFYIKGIEEYVENLPSYILYSELSLYSELNELCSMIHKYNIYGLDGKKDFSKTQDWIDFLKHVCKVNILIKDAIKRLTAESKTLGLVIKNSPVNLENIHTTLQLNIIKGLCRSLDLITSDNIAKEVSCDLDCYVLSDIKLFIYCLTTPCLEAAQSIIGDKELIALQQLKKALHELHHYHYYDEEQGYKKEFFQQQSWVDFLDVVRKKNILLKDAII